MKPGNEDVRLVFKGLVGLLVDHSQTDPENLRVFVSVTHGGEICRKSRCSRPITLSRADSVASSSSHVRRYVAIWDEADKGIVLNVKLGQVLCLQVCIQFASGSTLALGCCKWRSAQRGDLDLIVKHYVQEGAAISIDQKRDAMLRFYSATDVESYSDSSVASQMPTLPPSTKDTPRSVRKMKRGKMSKCEDAFAVSKNMLLEENECESRNFPAIQRLDSESSTVTVRHKNSSKCVETEDVSDDGLSWETLGGDQVKWDYFDTPDFFLNHKESWLNMDKKSQVWCVDHDEGKNIKLEERPSFEASYGLPSSFRSASPLSSPLPPRPPSKGGRNDDVHKASIVFDFQCRPGIDVLGIKRCEDDSTSVSSLFSSDSEEHKEDDHSKDVMWTNAVDTLRTEMIC